MNITGTILKELRMKKNITLEQLANEINEMFNINLTKSMISKWETGKSAPVYDHLKRLAIYYDVTTDFLLGFDHHEESKITVDLNNHLSAEKTRIRNSKKFYIRESINKILEYDQFTTKDLLFIQNFINFFKSEKTK